MRVGKDPKAIAAAALYLACNKRYTQKAMAFAAETTEVTIRSRVRELKQIGKRNEKH